MIYEIKSYGFTEYEQGLVFEQLKVISGRTKSSWLYKGEGTDADVVFCRGEISPINDRQVWINLCKRPLDCMHRVANDGRVNRDLCIETPIRILGLLEALSQAELLLESFESKPIKESGCAARFLGELEFISGNRVFIRAGSDVMRYYKDGNGHGYLNLTGPVESVLDALLLESSTKFQVSSVFSEVDPGGVGPFEWDVALDHFVWNLVWKEPLSEQDRIRWRGLELSVQSSPVLGLWQTNISVMKLTALFSRGFCNIEQAIALGVEYEDVIRYLKASDLAGLGVLEKQSEQQRARAEVREIRVSEAGFLDRFRNRLGLVFKA